MWILPLDANRSSRHERDLGGKARGLQTLLRCGLPVPSGFVVMPDAMRALFDAGTKAAGISWPSEFLSEIQSALQEIGSAPWIVRSSARDEDSESASAAGQYESVANVRDVGTLLEALVTCWASMRSPRVHAYQGGGAANRREAGAVIVQRMVMGEISGALFTRDPRNLNAATLVIEASAMHGGVVGGAVRPYRIEVARDVEKPTSVRSRVDGDGPFSLSDRALLDLGMLAIRAEAALGRPADLEWIWSPERGFSFVQLRPITTGTAPNRSDVIWTQRFSGERWIDRATPLGWSIVEPALERYTHWHWASRVFMQGSRMSRLVRGIPFFNVTLFPHLVLKTPWTPTPQFILELLPDDLQERFLRRRWVFPHAGLLLLIFGEALLNGRWRGHRWLWLTNPSDWERLAPQLIRGAAESRAREDVSAEVIELDRLRKLLEQYVGLHVWSLLWANLFYQVLGVLLEWVGGAALLRLRPDLVAGEGDDNLTLRTNRAVWGLAGYVKKDPAVREAVERMASGETARGIEMLESSDAGTAFLAKLRELLSKYGHRARASWEILSPRWSDDPQIVARMVLACLQGAEVGDPDRKQREAADAREKAENVLRKLSPLARWLVQATLANARTFSLLRENQRFVFDQIMLAIRECCRRIGAHLEADAKLLHGDDLRYLVLEEVRGLVHGEVSTVEAHRRIRERKQEATLPPVSATFLFGANPRIDAPGTERSPTLDAKGGATLQGIGISPGRYTGRVRIVYDFQDVSTLRDGEVLVVKATDPGWTPYFRVAGGLVTELGGLLSHAAVIAREYRLPAVANVSGATHALRTGQTVTIDGELGTVWGEGERD